MTFIVGIVFGLCIIKKLQFFAEMTNDAQRLHKLSLTRNVGASC